MVVSTPGTKPESLNDSGNNSEPGTRLSQKLDKELSGALFLPLVICHRRGSYKLQMAYSTSSGLICPQVRVRSSLSLGMLGMCHEVR